MYEIYMDRIKDLLNPMEDNLQVRESKEKGVYVDGIAWANCATAAEVMDNMDQGFMNRATAMTKMNPESSRSHCVTMLKVIKRCSNGSVTEAKIKMVDLAGSEKTSKTEATGNRLKEAMMINSSLTALSKVLKALCEGAKFIPYRDSKLTRLLSDALGGNSKTSLICAASPCAYNCEETMSTLRFGQRAKMVKCNAKINTKLSPDEYKKKVLELEKEVEVLTTENELLNLQQTELKKFLGAKNYSFDDIVKDVKIGQAEEISAEGMAFEEISNQVYEINKKSGMVMGGEVFKISMNSKKDLQARLEREKAENARIAQLVFACIQKGDYEQVSHILADKMTMSASGAVSGERVSEYEDQIADLKAELRGAEQYADQVVDELEGVNTRMDEMDLSMSSLKAQIAEHRFYKQKVSFLEKENEMVMKQIKSQGPMIADDVEDVDVSDLDWAAGCSPQVQAQIEKLAKNAARSASMVKQMKSERSINMEDIMDALNGNDKAGAVRKILESQRDTQTKLSEKSKQVEKMKRTLTMMATKDKSWRQLQQNWKMQLQQMEQAVILCSTIQKRDQNKFKTELTAKDEECKKLKAYVNKLHAQRSPTQKKKSPQYTIKKRAVQKKRRPARASPSPTREAGQVRA